MPHSPGDYFGEKLESFVQPRVSTHAMVGRDPRGKALDAAKRGMARHRKQQQQQQQQRRPPRQPSRRTAVDAACRLELDCGIDSVFGASQAAIDASADFVDLDEERYYWYEYWAAAKFERTQDGYVCDRDDRRRRAAANRAYDAYIEHIRRCGN